MGARKLVKSGNSSYVLSLPIQWVRKNSLDEGKLVEVNENEYNELIISTSPKKLKKNDDIIVIKIDGKDDETVYLELLTAYIRDPTSIIFEGEEIPHRVDRIISSIKSFIGLDIIEQSVDSIFVKNFFTLDKEVSPQGLLKRMDYVNRSSFTLLQSFFSREYGREEYHEMQKFCEQNNNLYLLIRKCILKLMGIK